MATIQLNVEGNVGELIPDLTKAASVMDTLQKKTVDNADKTNKAFQQNIKVTKEYNQVLVNAVTGIDEFGRKAKTLGDNGTAGTDKATEGMKSFRLQLKEATLDAQKAQQQFSKGLIDEKTLIAAQQRVADLKEEIQDFGKRIDALNPEAKFTVITQATQGLIGGFQAATGALALFGAESDDVQKAILKMQAVLNFSQGINQLLQLKDIFGNLAVVLGITATAQKGLTVATEAQAVAAGAATTATVAEAAATEGLGTSSIFAAGAINILRTAINFLMGPVGILLLAVGGLITLYEVFKEKTESAADQIKRLAEETERLINISKNTAERLEAENSIIQANIDLQKSKAALIVSLANSEVDANRLKAKADKENAEAEKVLLEKQNTERQQQFDRNIQLLKTFNRQVLELQFRNSGVNAGSDKDIEARVKEIDEIQKKSAELSIANGKLNGEIQANRVKIQQQIVDSNRDQVDANKERIRNEFEFNKRMTELREALAKTLTELDAKGASIGTSLEQLKADTAAKLQALEDFKKGLLKQIQEINDAEAQRRGGPTAVGKTATLDDKGEAAFEAAKNVIRKQAAEKEIQIEIDKQLKLIELKETGEQKEIDLIIVNAKKSEKELLDAGATELQIRKSVLDQIQAVRVKFANQRVQNEIDESHLVIEQIKLNGVSEAQAEKIRAQMRLEASLLGAEKQRNNVLLDPNFKIEDVNKLNAEIQKLKEQIEKGKKDIQKGEPLSLAQLFGIDEKNFDEFNAAAAQFVDGIKAIYDKIFEAENERVQQHLDNNQKLIDSDNDRIAELEAAIDKDTAANKRGLANDLNLHQQQLAAIKAQRDKDLADQKKLLEEKRKLAQQQAIVNSAETASSLIVSTVNVIKSLSGLPLGIGVVLGLAAAAALVAGFLSIKGNIEASQSLGEGGEVDGEPHSRGGNKYRSIDGRSRIKEIEDGEWLIKKRVAQKKKPLLKAINDENEPEYRRLMFEELFPFLKSQRIGLSEDVPDEIYQQRQELNIRERTAGTSIAMNGVEKRLDAFHDDFTKMVDDRMNEEHHHLLSDGTHIITKRGGKSLEIIKKQ